VTCVRLCLLPMPGPNGYPACLNQCRGPPVVSKRGRGLRNAPTMIEPFRGPLDPRSSSPEARIRTRVADRSWYTREGDQPTPSSTFKKRRAISSLLRKRDCGWASPDEITQLQDLMGIPEDLRHPASPEGFSLSVLSPRQRVGHSCKVSFSERVMGGRSGGFLLPAHSFASGPNLSGAGRWVRYNMTR